MNPSICRFSAALLLVFVFASYCSALPFGLSLSSVIDQVNPVPLTEDSELDYDAHQFVVSKGYPFEQHRVETDDHYILTLHRIPHGLANQTGANKTRPAIFLQHGLLASSDDWVINSEQQSLGFILANAGYDVWLGNVRGNKYSRMHSKINPTSNKYWDFSFHEIAEFDIPAMLDYISVKTGQEKVFYVGHSQGTLVALLAFANKPEWAAKRVKQFHALAPVAHLRSVTSGVKLLAPFSNMIGTFLNLIGLTEFMPTNQFVQSLADRSCSGRFPRTFCSQVIFIIAGFDGLNVNMTRLPVYVAHSPAGTSSKNMIHFGQMIWSKKFQHYDYGYYSNYAKYGSFFPPKYSMTNFNTPTVLYWGDQDRLADPDDVALVQADIGRSVVASHKIANTDHLDFVWGMNAATAIYPLLLKHLQES